MRAIKGYYTRLQRVTPLQYLSCVYIVTAPDFVYITSVLEIVLYGAALLLSCKAF